MRINYAEIARKIFVIEPFPKGALPVYDKDIKIRRYVMCA